MPTFLCVGFDRPGRRGLTQTVEASSLVTAALEAERILIAERRDEAYPYELIAVWQAGYGRMIAAHAQDDLAVAADLEAS